MFEDLLNNTKKFADSFLADSKAEKAARLNSYSQFIDTKALSSVSFRPKFLSRVARAASFVDSRRPSAAFGEHLEARVDLLFTLLTKHRSSEKSLDGLLEHFSATERFVATHVRTVAAALYAGDSVPKTRRAALWTALCLFATDLAGFAEFLALWQQSKTAPVEESEDLRQILHDLPRTFAGFGPKGSAAATATKQALLKEVLAAYAAKYGGYCQGMNFVCGFLAAFFFETGVSADTLLARLFFVFFALMQAYRLGQLFSKNLLGLGYGQLCTERALEKHAPKLHRAMVLQGVTSLTWSTQWFLTLFTYTFAFEDLPLLWDGIFLQGFVFVLKVASAILLVQERLNVHEQDKDLNKTISEFPKGFPLQIRRFVKLAHSFKFNYSDIEEWATKVSKLAE